MACGYTFIKLEGEALAMEKVVNEENVVWDSTQNVKTRVLN